MGRYVVGTISDIPVLRSRTVQLQGVEIALFRLSDNEILAVENQCPHKAGKLSEGIVCDHHVFCPLHDWKINLRDGLVQAPDEGCVRTFEADIENGQIIVKFPDKSLSA